MTIYHFKMTAEDNFEKLCNLTTNLLGLRKGSLGYKSRKMELQIPRSIVAVIARLEDDTHQKVIAKVLKRNRSLIYHYEKMHNSNYSSWSDYRNTFNKIYMAYTSIVNAKKEFFDLQHLRDHLRNFEVSDSNNHQITIRIRCGQLGTDVKLSYRQFYNQLEKCKLALQDYKYSIEII
tara:strand:+ start:881 stop:1411 length:531 start_codon:yes stop_codon:yes gene_type:complete